ncbi:hypothetical protein BDW71DRAFT_49269 [Aspergillus fruticulosus]
MTKILESKLSSILGSRYWSHATRNLPRRGLHLPQELEPPLLSSLMLMMKLRSYTGTVLLSHILRLHSEGEYLCLILLDQHRSRGVDLKLHRTYRAAVTLGPQLSKDRLVQCEFPLKVSRLLTGLRSVPQDERALNRSAGGILHTS